MIIQRTYHRYICASWICHRFYATGHVSMLLVYTWFKRKLFPFNSCKAYHVINVKKSAVKHRKREMSLKSSCLVFLKNYFESSHIVVITSCSAPDWVALLETSLSIVTDF